MSAFQEYDLKIRRNPFKLSKEQKLVVFVKKPNEKTSSKKQRILIASSPELRTFYNLNTQRESHHLHLKQIQRPKNTFLRNHHSGRQSSEYFNQPITSNRQSLNKKMSLYAVKSLSRFKSPQKTITSRTKQTEKSSIQKNKFSHKIYYPRKQQKTNLLYQKSQLPKSKDPRQVLSQKNTKTKITEAILKQQTKKQKKDTEKTTSFNKLLGNFRQIKQSEIGRNSEQSKRMMNFTFGKFP